MRLIKRIAHKTIWRTPKATNSQQIQAWWKANGDKTHRLFYDLNPDSVVFDLGGYEGQWASDIFAMYCCNVHVFEPVPEFARRIEARFLHNPKIHTYTFGLSSMNQMSKIALQGDASTLFGAAPNVDIQLVKVSDFFAEHHVQSVDLMKINIEGGEYDLLESLLDTHLISQVRDIQVQFHSFVQDSRARMTNIQARLAETHDLTYQYEFVWENWHRKTSRNDR